MTNKNFEAPHPDEHEGWAAVAEASTQIRPSWLKEKEDNVPSD